MQVAALPHHAIMAAPVESVANQTPSASGIVKQARKELSLDNVLPVTDSFEEGRSKCFHLF